MSKSEPPSKELLTRQLRACQRALDFVEDFTENWEEKGGRTVQADADLLIQAIFTRSTRTYEAVVKHLGNKGFGEQGAMLNRSLFEDMVDIHWVSLNRELAIKRVNQHDHWSRVLRVRVHRDFPGYFEGDEIEVGPPTEEEEREYKKLFGPHGEKSWTGLSMYARVKAVEPCWTEEKGRQHLRFNYAWVHKLNNETLHLSSYSLGRVPMAPREEEDSWHFTFGSTSELLSQALFSAIWPYIQILTLVFDEFDLDLEEDLDDTVTAPAMKEFLPLTDEDIKDVGRNDPCPCGSGLKFKRCHGE